MLTTEPTRRQLPLGAFLLAAIAAQLVPNSAGFAAEDGRRAIDVPQLGVRVRAPLAWSLITWGQEDQAFVLRPPQEHGSPPGKVSCTLALSQGTLADWCRHNVPHKRSGRTPAKGDPSKGNMVHPLADKLEQLDPQRFEALAAQDVRERWVSELEFEPDDGGKIFNLAYYFQHAGIVYAFSLLTDEAHYDAYRADFEELCAAARFSQPTKGVAPLPAGFWLQREYSFGLWLPSDLDPAFAARGKVLFSASRASTKPADAVELQILASDGAPWDLDAVRERLPGEIAAADPQSKVERCQLVPQGQTRALETIVRTVRDAEPIVIFARRFRGKMLNYELRAVCPGDQFEKRLEQWRRAADSFREIEAKQPGEVL